MSYTNIDSILEGNNRYTKSFSCNEREVKSPEELPEFGDVVGLLTNFNQYVHVRIESILNKESIYKGKIQGEISETRSNYFNKQLKIDELVEFSHSKIHGIFRKSPLSPSTTTNNLKEAFAKTRPLFLIQIRATRKGSSHVQRGLKSG